MQQNVGSMVSIIQVALLPQFGVEQIITKPYIIIFEKNMLFQSKHLSKNYFMSIEDWVITVVDYTENEKILRQ